MQLGIVSEVMHDGRICLLPSVFHAIRNLVLSNIDGRVSSKYKGKKKTGTRQIRFSSADGNFVMDFVGDADYIRYTRDLKSDDRVINVVTLDGPMTRDGAECSYGTKDLRDKIMRAADDLHCKGHIIYCNTPGGMASSVQDLRFAINYAHDRGQKVYMLIDGICASGGAFVAAICDKVFFINEEDEIGSIGMYSAFFTLADGAKNTITSEVYHEYYATASADKNGWYRKAAEGDMSALAADTERALAAMIANLKSDRPSILADQMTGKMYKMKDVVGSLVDGQSNLADVAKELLADNVARSGAPVARKETVAEPAAAKASALNNNPKTNNQMKQYSAIPAAAGLTEMETLDGTVYLNEEQAESLEHRLAELVEQNEGLQSQAQQLVEAQQALADAQAAHQTEIQNLTSQLEEARQALADAQTAHQTEIQDLTSQIAEAQQALTDAQTAHQTEIQSLNGGTSAQLQERDNTIAQLQQQVESLQQQTADLSATIEQLNQAAGATPQAGESPASNGQKMPNATTVATGCTFDPHLSAKENADRFNARRAAMNKH